MSEVSAAAVVIGMFIMLGMFANLVGVGLGIAAVVQKKAKKLFGILGLIFNGCLILLIFRLNDCWDYGFIKGDFYEKD